jgi:hypothetical protein
MTETQARVEVLRNKPSASSANLRSRLDGGGGGTVAVPGAMSEPKSWKSRVGGWAKQVGLPSFPFIPTENPHSMFLTKQHASYSPHTTIFSGRG